MSPSFNYRFQLLAAGPKAQSTSGELRMSPVPLGRNLERSAAVMNTRPTGHARLIELCIDQKALAVVLDDDLEISAERLHQPL
jgi:hypothetical protein